MKLQFSDYLFIFRVKGYSLVFCIFSEILLLCSFSKFKCMIENLKFLQVKQELALTWMHYVINFKISHRRAKYSCRCLINRKLLYMVYCAPKKHVVFFFLLGVINVTVIFQGFLYFKCGMIFSCCVKEASSQT